ncbi:hypothetical protein BY458DRAFT_552510 [Sporodiniella umbellata]|nr:hypothetical protein BY458DRAFT_552510 [Sporodiniella umbellata]
MAPLLLTVKGSKTFSPFSAIDSEDDLLQTWKICTKIKDALEQGSRLENLSWRLWFKQQLFDKDKFQGISSNTARRLSMNDMFSQKKDFVLPSCEMSELALPTREDYQLALPPFTSDQAHSEMVQINDIFDAFQMPESSEPIDTSNYTATMDEMADGWDFGYPSPTNPYYSPNQSNLTPPENQNLISFENIMIPSVTESNALYVANTSLPPPPPTATLQSKLLGIQYGGFIPPMSSLQPPLKSNSYSISAPSSPRQHSEQTSKPQSNSLVGNKPTCTNCGATSTPLWRRSADDELLCNACGLYQKLHNAPRPKTLKPHNARKECRDEEGSQLICSNCSTTTTPLWRRDDEGLPLCNACGLYLKLHHEKRPLSMKTDIIKKRQRYESTQGIQPRKNKKRETAVSQMQQTLPPHDSFMFIDDVFPDNNMSVMTDDVLSNYC